MQVIATAKGYYQKVRLPGEQFEMPDGSTGSWFTEVEKTPVKPAPKASKSTESKGGDDLV